MAELVKVGEVVDERASGLRRVASALVGITLALVARPAEAQQLPGPTPKTSLKYVNFIGGQLNPRGFGDDFRIRYRHRLYEGGSPVSEQNFAGVNGGAGFGTVAVRPTIGVELQPLSVLNLGASYNPIYFFKGLGLAQTYPSVTSDYRSPVLGPPISRAGGNYPLLVHQFTFTATVQAKVRSIFARSSTRLTHILTNPRDGDRAYLDPLEDITIYKRGWVVHNDSDLGVFVNKHFLVGLRHTLVAASYPSAAFLPTEPRESHDSPTSRLGPLASYSFFDRGGVVDTATISTLLQWYIAHRFRTGEATPAAVPAIGAALTLTGDLF